MAEKEKTTLKEKLKLKLMRVTKDQYAKLMEEIAAAKLTKELQPLINKTIDSLNKDRPKKRGKLVGDAWKGIDAPDGSSISENNYEKLKRELSFNRGGAITSDYRKTGMFYKGGSVKKKK
jgi:hypothetical protein